VELLEEFVSRSVLCWLATVDPSGAPSVSPKEVFEQQGLRISGRATVHPSAAVEMQAARSLLEGKTAGRFPFAEILVVEVDDVQPYAAPSWHLFPTMDPAERRAGALRAYRVRDLDD